MTTLIADSAVSRTTPASVPVYNPPPMTRAPQGQQMTPTSQPHQELEETC